MIIFVLIVFALFIFLCTTKCWRDVFLPKFRECEERTRGDRHVTTRGVRTHNWMHKNVGIGDFPGTESDNGGDTQWENGFPVVQN